MQRVTVTLDDELMSDLDRLIAIRGYQNRSEAIRDLARAGMRQAALEAGEPRDCVAALVYVYDHAARELSKRLTRAFHEHHDLAVSTVHVHLDHESCLEVSILRGRSDQVQRLAAQIIAERSVRYGELVLIPAETTVETHRHGEGGARSHAHHHVHP